MLSAPQFNAPWSRELRLMTILSIVLCLGIPGILLVLTDGKGLLLMVSAILSVFILVAASVFTVRGYTIASGELLIHRLGWLSRVSLTSMSGAEVDPTALQGTIRVFGNGGAFAFCGWMYNKKLGRFLLYGTDPRRSVVLRFPHRNVVITPDDPLRFVNQLGKRSAAVT